MDLEDQNRGICQCVRSMQVQGWECLWWFENYRGGRRGVERELEVIRVYYLKLKGLAALKFQSSKLYMVVY
jgi:hypothetical protein